MACWDGLHDGFNNINVDNIFDVHLVPPWMLELFLQQILMEMDFQIHQLSEDAVFVIFLINDPSMFQFSPTTFMPFEVYYFDPW